MAPPSHASLPTPAGGSRGRHRLPSMAGILLLGAVVVLAASCSSSSNGASSTTSTTSSTGSSPTTPATVSATGLPAIHHVFVIVLENEGYETTFGAPFNDSYLASTLPAAGALLTNYYGIGHFSNDNYVAMVSGQAPNPLNQADCQQFVDFPATATVAADGQISDSGCVFPDSVTTVANQLTQAHLSWKGYMQDMGNIPSRESALCGHPAVGAPDLTETAVAGDGYATRHDPFVYFHSIIDNPAYCDAHVVPLGTSTGTMPGQSAGATGLATDLKSIGTTPNLSFITPNLCLDGHDAPCVNQQASPSPLANIDTFLHTWVPMITSSPAFKKDGLLEITFDESDTDNGNPAQATACCNEVPGPAAALPGIAGPGGGRTGTVLLSPFIKGGTVSAVPYNHFSTLATIEDIFGLSKLGQAKTVSATFGKDVFNRTG